MIGLATITHRLALNEFCVCAASPTGLTCAMLPAKMRFRHLLEAHQLGNAMVKQFAEQIQPRGF